MNDREFNKRKNVLDMHFQKFLQYKIATILIIFTFFIAIAIAFVTKQLRIDSFIDISFVGILSTAILGFGINLIIEFDFHLQKIVKEIKKL